MPELPEVESIRIGLEKSLLNKAILNVEIRNEKIVSSNSNIRTPNKHKTSEFKNSLINRKIISIKRRAKNIIVTLDNESIILIHLKMTGQLIVNGEINKHTHIIFYINDGSTLLYNDTRQFGYVLFFKNIEEAISLGHMTRIGLEPMDSNFTFEFLHRNILNKKKNLKSVLLEQSIVVGCGNIYTDEICFASNVLPERICNTLTIEEIKSLHKNIKSVIQKAIKLGGSSVSDYKLSDGTRGGYARHHKVYGRVGLECFNCGNILEKSLIAGRTTVYCTKCQR